MPRPIGMGRLDILSGPHSPPVDQQRFNPARDYFHNYPELVRETASLLEEGEWPEFDEAFAAVGVTRKGLQEAFSRLSSLLATAECDEHISAYQAAERSGWTAVPAAARFALQAAIGQIILIEVFMAIREANSRTSQRLTSPQQISMFAHQYADYWNLPPWRRWLISRCPILFVRNFCRRRYRRDLAGRLGPNVLFPLPIGDEKDPV